MVGEGETLETHILFFVDQIGTTMKIQTFSLKTRKKVYSGFYYKKYLNVIFITTFFSLSTLTPEIEVTSFVFISS